MCARVTHTTRVFSTECCNQTVVSKTKPSLCQVSSSNPKRPMQRTPGNLVRSLECLSKCCLAFNPTCDSEEERKTRRVLGWRQLASDSQIRREDTGLQIAENSKFFGITLSIMSFSNEGKELVSQYEGHCGCPVSACEEMIKLSGQDHCSDRCGCSSAYRATSSSMRRQGRHSFRPTVIDLRRKTARRREDTVRLQHPVGKNVLQNILTDYNEVNCVDKKLGAVHRDGRARELD